MEGVRVRGKKKYRDECRLAAVYGSQIPDPEKDYERFVGWHYNSNLATGIKAVPVARAILFALGGVPTDDIADAMSSSGEQKEIEFIIKKYRAISEEMSFHKR